MKPTNYYRDAATPVIPGRGCWLNIWRPERDVGGWVRTSRVVSVAPVPGGLRIETQNTIYLPGTVDDSNPYISKSQQKRFAAQKEKVA